MSKLFPERRQGQEEGDVKAVCQRGKTYEETSIEMSDLGIADSTFELDLTVSYGPFICKGGLQDCPSRGYGVGYFGRACDGVGI